MFKWLFPLLFLIAAGAVQAQPQAPSGPLYDPQGRLIPYDPSSPDALETPRPASKPKASAKKSKAKAKGKATAPKPTAVKAKKSSKASATGPVKKAQPSAAKAKSSSKPKKKPAP